METIQAAGQPGQGAAGVDRELKPGEARLVFLSEEERVEHERFMAEVAANPEKFKDHAWEDEP